MSKAHTGQEILEQQIKDAEAVVTVGGTYQHYKGADKLYTVLGIGVTEADESLCVIYRAEYGKRLTFLRPINVWLETVEWDGKTVPLFKKTS